METTGLAKALQTVFGTRSNPWSVCLVADDAERRLQDLVVDLTRKASDTGDGKRITSGHAYWGSEPTFAWARSCTDPLYSVMRESIESFTTGWAELLSQLDGGPYHYVSFGPGTGEKDATIIRDLMRINPNFHYVPVDMSAEMLRLAVRGPVLRTGIRPDRVLPVQLNFARPNGLAALATLVEELTGGEPVLYSLLGNTVANFDDDVELLRTLTGKVRSCDRFVLEAATTESLDNRTAAAAALEYRQSRSFCEFATSALLRHTDLHIDMDQLAFVGGIEDEKSLRVKVIYQNLTDRPIRFTLLSNRTSVLLPAGDTIRVYLTRKYAATGLKSVLADCGLTELASTHNYFLGDRSRARFGMNLMLVSSDGTSEDRSTSAYDLWG